MPHSNAILLCRNNGDLMNQRKEFYTRALKVSLPIVVQNLLSATISSTDVIMLNYVSQSAISAVSLAANFTSIIFMIYFGLTSGVTMLCSQYNGKGDIKAIHLIEGIALKISIVASFLMTLCAFTIPELMMRIFTADPELIRLGAVYLRYVALSYLFWSVSEVYMAVLKSVERVTICTVLNLAAFVANILFNAVFIFGLLGAPKMGAAGVALGTTISRLIALIGCIIVSGKSTNVKIKLSYMFRKNKVLFSDFVKMALPVLINDCVWGLAFSLYSAIIGHLDSDAVAAYSIVNVVRNFGTIFCFAIGGATGILLGNDLGAGKLEEAEVNAKRLMLLTVAFAVLGGILMGVSIPGVLSFADVSEQAKHYLKYMMIINTYYIMGTAINTTLIVGVFRAGGDSKFGMICDAIDMWGYALPMGFLAAFVFKLPVIWVYFILCTDEFVKWPWVFKHYFSKGWVRNITRSDLP